MNHKCSLENAFQEILYKIDNWIKEGSDWIIELSLHTSTFQLRPLPGSSYIKLPTELESQKRE